MIEVVTKGGLKARAERRDDKTLGGLVWPFVGEVEDVEGVRPWKWNCNGGSYASSNLYDLDRETVRELNLLAAEVAGKSK